MIGHEFTLPEKASGISVDQICATPSDDVKTQMVHQLTGYLIELHAQPWREGYVGGLTLTPTGEIAFGPPIDEGFWQTPDMDKYWSASAGVESTETLESFNPIPAEGFSSYTAYTNGCLERYVHAIEIHPSLEPYSDLIPRIREFMAQLPRIRQSSTTSPTSWHTKTCILPTSCATRTSQGVQSPRS